MKKLLSVLLCAAALLIVPAAAQAYAIYNHSDHDVCIYSGGFCNFTVKSHSTYNGAHGAGLDNVQAGWKKGDKCYGSDTFSIPKGGFIRIYNNEVKIYNHQNEHLSTKGIHHTDCTLAPYYLL